MKSSYCCEQVDLDEVRGAVTTFVKKSDKTRVFLPQDPAFLTKLSDFIASACGCGVCTGSGESFTVVDNIIHASGESPKGYSLTSGDVIALLDNTKLGLFGNILKSRCQEGVLITTEGILALNVYEGKALYSGFVSWYTLANGNTATHGVIGGARLVRPYSVKTGKYPAGERVSAVVSRFKDKNLQDNFEILITHIKRIAQGRGDEFDEYDVIGESAEESEFDDSADESEVDESANE